MFRGWKGLSMSAIRRFRRQQKNGLLYPCETVDSEAEAGSRGWDIRGWLLVFVLGSILVGLLGLRSEMKKGTRVFGDQPITSSQTASAVVSAVAPESSPVFEMTNSATSAVRKVTVTLRPRLSSGTN